MIGLVLVSHSHKLAEGLAELVRQMAPSELPLAIAAGIGPNREELGTDAVAIAEAIQAVYQPEGVLVLMDLGSALLSAEMARELLSPEMAEMVRFCAGPFVEGAVVSAVQAGLGSSLDQACQEALQALLPKAEQLGVEINPVGAQAAGGTLQVASLSMENEPVQERRLKLINLHGLHARPAARFVRAAAAFQADVQVRNLTTGKGPVSARSLNGVATLGAIQGHEIAITARGAEAAQAVEALSQLVEEGFGEAREEAPAAPESKPSPEEPSKGEQAGMRVVPIAEGIALGPLYRYAAPLPPIPEGPGLGADLEWQRFQAALESARAALQGRRPAGGGREAPEMTIFDAHLLILQDPDLLSAVHQRLQDKNENAAAAWQASIEAVAVSYAALPDAYQQQRAADVRDVGRQVLFALAGKLPIPEIHLPEPAILVAEELTPTETAALDLRQVLGLVTLRGGPTSHSAILARALGIPAVAGASPTLASLPNGTSLALDGARGRLWIDPPEELQADLLLQRKSWLAERERLIRSSFAPAITRDGRKVEVAANAGSAADARAGVENGAEGIGLLRTEFLFLERTVPPSEGEQVASLLEIGAVLGDRPVVVRTLDVGGDKPLPYLDLPVEANPFLGVRALRLSLRRPDLFATQLRAILRAGVGRRFQIMFPMVANLEEVLQARQALVDAHIALETEGLPHLWPVPTGIMVEIPSAALLAQVLAPQVDFFSIGTNDLTQYTLAAERGNPELSSLMDALHPAVLRLIYQVVQAAHAHGKWVGICGELAGDPLATPVLAGLGVDELSLNPAGIPRVKARLREISYAEAQILAQKVLAASSAAEARSLAEGFG